MRLSRTSHPNNVVPIFDFSQTPPLVTNADAIADYGGALTIESEKPNAYWDAFDFDQAQTDYTKKLQKQKAIEDTDQTSRDAFVTQTPWHAGGKTTAENCQMLCKEDNRRKSGK